MKIIATSDTHGELPEIPECDLFLHAGDVCPIEGSHDEHVQQNWLKGHFRPWLEQIPARDIVWIGGNHDFGCESGSFKHLVKNFPGHYLLEESVEVQGMTIFGMPWTPNLMNWAFYASDRAWGWLGENIPTDTDIVLLHSPPSGLMLDGGHPEWAAPYILTELTQRVQPAICVFGHIHEGYGEIKVRGTHYANVSYLDEFYDKENPNALVEFEL